MDTCNLAQAGFIARISDEYLEGMLSNRPLAKHFVDACVGKLAEASQVVYYKRHLVSSGLDFGVGI